MANSARRLGQAVKMASKAKTAKGARRVEKAATGGAETALYGSLSAGSTVATNSINKSIEKGEVTVDLSGLDALGIASDVVGGKLGQKAGSRIADKLKSNGVISSDRVPEVEIGAGAAASKAGTTSYEEFGQPYIMGEGGNEE